MAGAWSCPHEEDGLCNKVARKPCDPGMKGCVLAGRYAFFNDDAKNERLRVKRAREAECEAAARPAGTEASAEPPITPDVPLADDGSTS